MSEIISFISGFALGVFGAAFIILLITTKEPITREERRNRKREGGSMSIRCKLGRHSWHKHCHRVGDNWKVVQQYFECKRCNYRKIDLWRNETHDWEVIQDITTKIPCGPLCD